MINDCDLDFIILSTPFGLILIYALILFHIKFNPLRKTYRYSISEHNKLIELSDEYQTLFFLLLIEDIIRFSGK